MEDVVGRKDDASSQQTFCASPARTKPEILRTPLMLDWVIPLVQSYSHTTGRVLQFRLAYTIIMFTSSDNRLTATSERALAGAVTLHVFYPLKYTYKAQRHNTNESRRIVSYEYQGQTAPPLAPFGRDI